MPQKTQNLGLEVFDFDTDSSPAFINGVAGLTDSNMHKIDKAITEMVKVNNEGVSLNLITSPSGEELVKINDYTFSTDTINLRTPSSDNAEERYRELLKATSQEFESDGSDIAVENGIEHQVLVGAKLEGQTVKNIINYDKFVHKQIKNLGDNTFEVILDPKYGALFGLDYSCLHGFDYDKTYTVIINVLENTLNKRMADAGTSAFKFYLDSIGQTGIKKIVGKPSKDKTWAIRFFTNGGDSSESPIGTLKFKIQILEGDWSNKEIGYIEGLSSTKATLINNGEKYTIYNPIIEGKTYLMRASKGTQDWAIDDISQERDFEKYDYKLDSLNGLHGIYSTKDKVDLQKREITSNTVEIKLDDIIDNSYAVINGAPKDNNTSVFAIVTDIKFENFIHSNNFYIMSNFFDGFNYTQVSMFSDIVSCGIYVTGDKKIVIAMRVSKEDSLGTLDGFKNYYRGKGIIFRVVCDPITRQLTEEEYEYYFKQIKPKNINSVNGISDKIEFKEHGAVFTKNISVYNTIYTSLLKKNGEKIITIETQFSDNANGLNINKIICNKLKTVPFNSFPEEEFVSYSGHYIHIGISKDKLRSETVTAVNDYFNQNGYEIMLPYTGQNKEEFIPNETAPHIPIQETNNFSFGEEIKPSKASIEVPIDKIRDLEERVAQLKGVMTSISNLSLLGNYIEDEYNKEINQL